MDESAERKIIQSVELLKEITAGLEFSKEFPLVVNFSGGKDSTACLLLARRITDHVHCFYMDAGFELPGTLEYVKDRARDLGVPLLVSDPDNYPANHRLGGKMEGCKNLWDYIEHYGYFPTAAQRWCSIWCKQRPGKVCLRSTFGKQPLLKLVGVKITDSPRRRNVYGSEEKASKYGGKFVRPDREMNPTKLVYPILDWTGEDCFNFIKSEGFEPHPGYKQFGVSGCAWCPVYKPHTLRLINEAHPGIYDRILLAEERIGKKAYHHADRTLREVLDDPKIENLKPIKRTVESPIVGTVI